MSKDNITIGVANLAIQQQNKNIYKQDERISSNEDGKYYVKVEPWNNGKENSTLSSIVFNSYDVLKLNEFGIESSEIIDAVYNINDIKKGDCIYPDSPIYLPGLEDLIEQGVVDKAEEALQYYSLEEAKDEKVIDDEITEAIEKVTEEVQEEQVKDEKKDKVKEETNEENNVTINQDVQNEILQINANALDTSTSPSYYKNDNRIHYDEKSGYYTVTAESTGNNSLWSIINNSYDLNTLQENGISFSKILEDVVALNNISNPNIINVNDEIKLPYPKYDEQGRLVEDIADGKIVTFEYNEKNQIISKTSGDDVTAYKYDDCGRIKCSVNDGKKTKYKYDDETGNIKRKTYYENGEKTGYTKLKYDGDNVTETNYSADNELISTKTLVNSIVSSSIDKKDTTINQVSSKDYNTFYDSFSNSKFRKTVLENKADFIYEVCTKYNVDPYLACAIMAHESAWGTSYAICVQNNPGGYMNPDDEWRSLLSFDSLDKGIEAVIRNLGSSTYQGLNSIGEIGAIYCPIGADNDPTNLNQNWIPRVVEYYNTFTGQNIDELTNLKTLYV